MRRVKQYSSTALVTGFKSGLPSGGSTVRSPSPVRCHLPLTAPLAPPLTFGAIAPVEGRVAEARPIPRKAVEADAPSRADVVQGRRALGAPPRAHLTACGIHAKRRGEWSKASINTSMATRRLAGRTLGLVSDLSRRSLSSWPYRGLHGRVARCGHVGHNVRAKGRSQV